MKDQRAEIDAFVASLSPDALFLGLCIILGAVVISMGMPTIPSNVMLEQRLLKINEKLANIVQAIKAAPVQRNSS